MFRIQYENDLNVLQIIVLSIESSTYSRPTANKNCLLWHNRILRRFPFAIINDPFQSTNHDTRHNRESEMKSQHDPIDFHSRHKFNLAEMLSNNARSKRTEIEAFADGQRRRWHCTAGWWHWSSMTHREINRRGNIICLVGIWINWRRRSCCWWLCCFFNWRCVVVSNWHESRSIALVSRSSKIGRVVMWCCSRCCTRECFEKLFYHNHMQFVKVFRWVWS